MVDVLEITAKGNECCGSKIGEGAMEEQGGVVNCPLFGEDRLNGGL